MIRPRWLKWLLISVVGLVVIVVGGVFAIHQVQGKSKPPLTLSVVTTTTAPPTAAGASTSAPALAGVDGTWKVGSGSQAGYRIQETLFGVSNTAVGRTTAVTGSITISGTTVSAGSFTVDLTKVTSDRSQRDDQFQTRIMNTSAFPTAKFTLTKPIDLNTLPAEGVQVTESATGDLSMHGVTKSVTFQVTAQRAGSNIQANGSIPITFADWNISNPSGGPATTGSTGTLEFLLSFSHS
jgi:polyisoprenoid-binding protein YceI